MAGWADVVLPESTYLERYDDLNTELFREPFVGAAPAGGEPPARPETRTGGSPRAGEKLGLGALLPLEGHRGVPRGARRRHRPQLAKLKRRAWSSARTSPINVEEGTPLSSTTPSGKVEFWSTQLAEKGFDAVPRYTPHAEPPPGYFRLLFGRAPVHTFSRTQTNPLLSEAMSENEVWVNADVARRWGLDNGERVRLLNQDGVASLPVKVKATERIRTDCVYMVHGFGHTAKGLKRTHRQGGFGRPVDHPLRGRSADGRHRHERQLRHLRAARRRGGLTMARFGMVIDTRRCVGCMDCVVACKTENEVPEGFCRDWIATEVRGKFPTLTMEIRTERCNHCDNRRASRAARPGPRMSRSSARSSWSITTCASAARPASPPAPTMRASSTPRATPTSAPSASTG
jgi:NAD-dependent dihydropyrimidine dehydrogenase PreA subunit